MCGFVKDWIRIALSTFHRREVIVHFHQHAEIKNFERNLDVDRIVETIRIGKVFERKCTYPDRIAFSCYFKKGFTYIVIAKVFPNSLQVITSWKNKGRRT